MRSTVRLSLFLGRHWQVGPPAWAFFSPGQAAPLPCCCSHATAALPRPVPEPRTPLTCSLRHPRPRSTRLQRLLPQGYRSLGAPLASPFFATQLPLLPSHFSPSPILPTTAPLPLHLGAASSPGHPLGLLSSSSAPSPPHPVRRLGPAPPQLPRLLPSSSASAGPCAPDLPHRRRLRRPGARAAVLVSTPAASQLPGPELPCATRSAAGHLPFTTKPPPGAPLWCRPRPGFS